MQAVPAQVPRSYHVQAGKQHVRSHSEHRRNICLDNLQSGTQCESGSRKETAARDLS